MLGEEEAPDVNKDTPGHEADRLLRTITRAFIDNTVVDDLPLADTCSIVLDIILRNHYQTCEEEICRVCRGVQPNRIHKAIGVLVRSGILVFEKRLDKYVELLQPKTNRHKQVVKGGFVVFQYGNQRMQLSEEQVRQIERQEKQKPFYYVNYHQAVELIRYRLFKLLNDSDEKSASVVYRCTACGKQYSEEQVLYNMDESYESICLQDGCGGKVKRVVCGSKTAEEERRKNFLKALQPVINLVNEVMKKTYDSFEQYSPDEERLMHEFEKEVAKKHAVPGAVDDLVDIEESIDRPCPGALDKSVRVRSRAIPWLVHHGFFSHPTEEEETYDVDEDVDSSTPAAATAAAAAAPAAKRSRVSENSKEETSLSEMTEEDKEIIRKAQSFDRYLQQRLETKQPQMDLDEVPDTVSIRSGSTCSDEQEPESDAEISSAFTSPQPDQQKPSQGQMATRKVCQGFDEDILASHGVYVRGELLPLDAITLCDIKRMNDDEYTAFAHEFALVAGIS